MILGKNTNPALARIVPFMAFILIMASTSFVPEQAGLVLGFDARWLYVLRISLVGALLWFFRNSYEELSTGPRIDHQHWPLAVAVGVIVFLLWIQLDRDGLRMSSSQGFDPRSPNAALQLVFVSSRTMGAAVIVPIMEELFWRSFLLRWLHNANFTTVNPGEIRLRALLLSSVLFAMEHNLWFAGWLAGLAYGWLYTYTRNLWSAILAHSITNGILSGWILFTYRWEFW